MTHRVRAEEALDPAERAVGAFPFGAGVAPEAGLQSEVDEHAVGDQPQPDQAGGGPVPARRGGRR